MKLSLNKKGIGLIIAMVATALWGDDFTAQFGGAEALGGNLDMAILFIAAVLGTFLKTQKDPV
jgi:hypothetical protein